MTQKKTVVFRLCAGCDTPLGLQLLPWAGSSFESSHALCAVCDERIGEALGRRLDDLPQIDSAAVRSAA